ncbi:unnamed protein product [Peniophora sp. CBMAI 1063]|nr:unnamed protein product [Peniophora sp. CBMAI 1063]
MFITSKKRRRVVYIASESLAKISARLPSNRGRAVLVHGLASSLGLLANLAGTRDAAHEEHDVDDLAEDEDSESGGDESTSIRVLRPELAAEDDLLSFHDTDLVERLLSGQDAEPNDAGYGLEDDCAPFPGMREYVLAVAGASLAAARELVEGRADVSICWDGGRHHAHKSRVSGFCYVNDCVLAILALRRLRPPPHPPATTGPSISRPKLERARVMYLDLDLHYGDGVAGAFCGPNRAKSSNVLTLSIHHAARGFFPLAPCTPDLLSSEPTHAASGAGPLATEDDPYSLTIPLHAGASARTYAAIWPGVEAVAHAFVPHAVVVQCGVDALAGDPCAVGNWCLGGEGGLGWCIRRVIDEWGCKVLLLGGGGYNSPNAARAWAYLTSIAKGEPLSLETHIPDHAAFPAYAPSFTLDVPAGNARDQNDEAYVQRLADELGNAAEVLRSRGAGV